MVVTTLYRNMGCHVPRLGVSPLQGESGGFDSHMVHKKHLGMLGSPVTPPALGAGELAGSNPAIPTIFYYQRVFIVMVLLEGRKEDIYNKYKGQIDADRKLDSSFEPLSIYDILIGEPFLQQTNYKYLEPLVQQYFFNNEVYPRQGKELEELEPNHPNTAIESIRSKRQFVQNVVSKVEFFDKNKDKYPKKDLREYIGDWFERDFLNFTNELIKQTSEKQEEKKARKEVDKVYDSDTILIVKPKTHTASCYYGAGTKWCTTTRNNSTYFESHTKNANLYYIIVKKKNVSDRFYKIAINIKPGQKLIDSDWYDVQDNKFNFSEKDWKNLIEHTKNSGLEFMCTPFSIEAAQWLFLNKAVKRWKVGSGDAANFPLIDYLISTNLPLIIAPITRPSASNNSCPIP